MEGRLKIDSLALAGRTARDRRARGSPLDQQHQLKHSCWYQKHAPCPTSSGFCWRAFPHSTRPTRAAPPPPGPPPHPDYTGLIPPRSLGVVVHLETLRAARGGNKEAAVTLSAFYILLLFAVWSLLTQPSRGLRGSGRTLPAAAFTAAGSETGFRSS